MEEISKKLYEKLNQTCNFESTDIISLSGGLDSTILAYFLKEKKSKAITIIAKNFPANDLPYCQLAAKEFGLPLTIIKVETQEILEAIKGTISILKNFNDIEIRNNLVMYLAVKWVKDNGYRRIITGDGADELFAGYRFLIQKSEKELEKEIQRIYSVMHFPTQKIGRVLGVKVKSPFLDESIVEFSKSIPARFKVRNENGQKYGKWILRKTFERKIPFQIAWREKSAMQDGAGTNGLTNLFESIINDKLFSQKKEEINQEYGISIRTKESMHYFEVYKDLYSISNKKLNSETSCPYCHFQTKNAKFCRMCGAFPI